VARSRWFRNPTHLQTRATKLYIFHCSISWREAAHIAALGSSAGDRRMLGYSQAFVPPPPLRSGGGSASGAHLVARISWAERLGLGSVEDHSPFGERNFAGRWSRLLSPQASTGGKSG
jgi:hypothetical protein